MTLPRNPFAVRGCLHRCWLLTWRTPAGAARPLLPEPLELITHGGFAFWNVVICRIERMRPAGVPPLFGFSYWHVAYRLLARAQLRSGEDVAGLHFVRSDADHRLVSALGNLVTDFRLHPARIRMTEAPEVIRGDIRAAGGDAQFRLRRGKAPELSTGSPFCSVEEAAAALKYKPVALSRAGADAVNIVRVARAEESWLDQPVTLEHSDWEFFNTREVAFEWGVEMQPLEYLWRRGEVAEVRR